MNKTNTLNIPYTKLMSQNIGDLLIDFRKSWADLDGQIDIYNHFGDDWECLVNAIRFHYQNGVKLPNEIWDKIKYIENVYDETSTLERSKNIEFWSVYGFRTDQKWEDIREAARDIERAMKKYNIWVEI